MTIICRTEEQKNKFVTLIEEELNRLENTKRKLIEQKKELIIDYESDKISKSEYERLMIINFNREQTNEWLIKGNIENLQSIRVE